MARLATRTNAAGPEGLSTMTLERGGALIGGAVHPNVETL